MRPGQPRSPSGVYAGGGPPHRTIRRPGHPIGPNEHSSPNDRLLSNEVPGPYSHPLTSPHHRTRHRTCHLPRQPAQPRPRQQTPVRHRRYRSDLTTAWSSGQCRSGVVSGAIPARPPVRRRPGRWTPRDEEAAVPEVHTVHEDPVPPTVPATAPAAEPDNCWRRAPARAPPAQAAVRSAAASRARTPDRSRRPRRGDADDRSPAGPGAAG